jgi:hypothetical protein
VMWLGQETGHTPGADYPDRPQADTLLENSASIAGISHSSSSPP